MQAQTGNSYFLIATLIAGLLSTAGTALRTAKPYRASLIVHKTGIGLYFLGVIVLQMMIFTQGWTLNRVFRILPALSLLLVILSLVFLPCSFCMSRERSAGPHR